MGNKNKRDIWKMCFTKYTSIYLCAILFFLPLIITNGYYNITESKYYYFMAVSILTFLAFAFFKILKREFDIERISIIETDIPFVLFFVAFVISAMFSCYKQDAIFGSASRYQGVITIFVYLLIYFLVSRNFKFGQNVLLSAMLGLTLVSIFGVLNCFDIDLLGFYGNLSQDNKSNYISTIGNINFYSSYICLLLPLVVCGFCLTKTKLSTVIYTLVLITGTMGAMVTSSESFVVGFATAMLIIPLFLFSDILRIKKFFTAVLIMVFTAELYMVIYQFMPIKNVRISKLLSLLFNPIVAVIVAIICFVFLYVLEKHPENLKKLKITYCLCLAFAMLILVILFLIANTNSLGILDEYFKITDKWGTYRGGIWRQCIDIYKGLSVREKLFGIGPESLYRYTVSLDVHNGRILDQAHNEYLQYLLTIGVVGLLTYLSIIGAVIFIVVKKLKNNALAIGLFSGLVAFWIQATVNIAQPFTTPIMYIFISCIAGMYYKEKEQSPKGV
ncbi:MAG: O-antigen ligase family protein [Clostridia bacterium]|nr:O-antigen ligase family protein [Clostridia bacterium]